MKQTQEQANIVVFGGSGHWTEQNHYPAILSLRQQGYDVRVVAICDIVDPYSEMAHTNYTRESLDQILAQDSPDWINPADFKDDNALTSHLQKYAVEHHLNVAIIATNPTCHYLYALWAAQHSIHVLCDKPLIATPDASWVPAQAQLIEKQFTKLLGVIRVHEKRNSNYTFCMPLRRRVLAPYVEIAQGLRDVYERTGQGITHMNIIVNGGIHRYPREFLKAGAHGFVEGIGSLSHSNYHYLDFMAWCLQLAPGDAVSIGVRAISVTRVQDYLNAKGYKQLMKLNKEDAAVVVGSTKLSNSILRAELDFTFCFTLYNAQGNPVGQIMYSNSHTAFSPRLARYSPDTLDHANQNGGGRMSQVFVDVHQGVLQNWLAIKNDIVFNENVIEVTRRQHPALEGRSLERKVFSKAYEIDTLTPVHLTEYFLKKTIGEATAAEISQLPNITSQILSERIFSACYEQIAHLYKHPTRFSEVIIPINSRLR
ncbi:MAG TPA: Gfo/Idh/MocA family oxidoreductase [Candidatus Saccharimonadales bacterium]|nr:Gfo/Idh/MocA family oxidoreductase [Candidatus Saccharimonadales bacterium]